MSFSTSTLASASHSRRDQPRTAPDDLRIELPSAPEAIFRDLIAENHRVCSRCYTRLRRTEPLPFEVGDTHHDLAHYIYRDRPSPHDSAYPRLDTEYFEQPTLPGRRPRGYPAPKSGAANELRGSRYCANCGEFDPERNISRRSIAEVVDVAPNISQTLTEYGVVHDWPFFLALVPRLKRSSLTDGDDHATFRLAVTRAVERAERP